MSFEIKSNVVPICIDDPMIKIPRKLTYVPAIVMFTDIKEVIILEGYDAWVWLNKQDCLDNKYGIFETSHDVWLKQKSEKFEK